MAAALEVRTQSVGPWPMNSYAFVCQETGKSVLVDPGAEPERLEAMLAGSEPVAILLTHSHPDHIGALAGMRARLGVPVLCHEGPHVGGVTIEAARHLAHGDTVEVGARRLRVYHTPGHTQDMLCFFPEGGRDVVVGDTLFDGGPGKTWSSDGFQQTLETLRTIVLGWPDETICHPGHGPAFRLGDRRAAIERFLARDHDDFFGDAEWEEK